MMTIDFNGTALQLHPDTQAEFVMSTIQVARGLGCDSGTIRSCKLRNMDEIKQGQHWRVLQIATASGTQKAVCWTKEGIIKLGLFIKSEKAAQFREWVTKLVLDATQKTSSHVSTPIALPQSPQVVLPADVYETLLSIESKSLRTKLLKQFKALAAEKGGLPV